MTALPPGWAEASLVEVADIVLGQSPPGSSYNHEGVGIPFFQGKAEFGDRYPTVAKWTTEPKKLAEEGDILLSVRAPVGPTNLAPMDCAVGRGLHAVSPRPGVERDYLLWAIRVTAHVLAEGATGSTFEAVSGSQVRAHRVPIAPTAEQQRIVDAIEEHFTRIDAAEAAVDLACRRLVQLRQSAIETLFDHPEWQWTTLGEIAEVKGGVTKDSKRQSDPCFVEVPYLRVANVQRGYLNLDEVTTIRVDPNKAKSLALQPGDILFNEGGDRDKLGRGWVWEGQVPDCIHQNHVFRARLASTDFDPRFVSTHGNTWGKRWFEENGKQTTNLASINMTTLKKFPVPAPPTEEQAKLMDELGRVQEGIGRMADQLAVAKQRAGALRQTILAEAFAGRLLPQDPADEPAQVLLDRIAEERAVQKPGAVRGRGRVAS